MTVFWIQTESNFKKIDFTEKITKGGGTEIDRQSLDFVVPAPRGGLGAFWSLKDEQKVQSATASKYDC